MIMEDLDRTIEGEEDLSEGVEEDALEEEKDNDPFHEQTYHGENLKGSQEKERKGRSYYVNEVNHFFKESI